MAILQNSKPYNALSFTQQIMDIQWSRFLNRSRKCFMKVHEILDHSVWAEGTSSLLILSSFDLNTHDLGGHLQTSTKVNVCIL